MGIRAFTALLWVTFMVASFIIGYMVPSLLVFLVVPVTAIVFTALLYYLPRNKRIMRLLGANDE